MSSIGWPDKWHKFPHVSTPVKKEPRNAMYHSPWRRIRSLDMHFTEQVQWVRIGRCGQTDRIIVSGADGPSGRFAWAFYDAAENLPHDIKRKIAALDSVPVGTEVSGLGFRYSPAIYWIELEQGDNTWRRPPRQK